MFINIAFWDISLWYEGWISILNNLSNTKNYCLINWKVNKIEAKLNIESSCLSDFNIYIKSNQNKDFLIKSFWVEKQYLKLKNCWNEAWIYNKIENKNYNPQLWDYLVAKINPENNYISELFLMNWKSWNEINDFAKTLNLPYCSWNTITQEPEKIPQNNFNYYLFWSLILTFIIILVLVFKLLKFKK